MPQECAFNNLDGSPKYPAHMEFPTNSAIQRPLELGLDSNSCYLQALSATESVPDLNRLSPQEHCSTPFLITI